MHSYTWTNDDLPTYTQMYVNIYSYIHQTCIYAHVHMYTPKHTTHPNTHTGPPGQLKPDNLWIMYENIWGGFG